LITPMSNQPQPGDIWERDGERRTVIGFRRCATRLLSRGDDGVIYWDTVYEWDRWQSGAKLVERMEPTQ